MVNDRPLPEHQVEAIDNNDKAPLKIMNSSRSANPARLTTSTTTRTSLKRITRSSKRITKVMDGS